MGACRGGDGPFSTFIDLYYVSNVSDVSLKCLACLELPKKVLIVDSCRGGSEQHVLKVTLV